LLQFEFFSAGDEFARLLDLLIECGHPGLRFAQLSPHRIQLVESAARIERPQSVVALFVQPCKYYGSLGNASVEHVDLVAKEYSPVR
jgi:hypothetical protein